MKKIFILAFFIIFTFSQIAYAETEEDSSTESFGPMYNYESEIYYGEKLIESNFSFPQDNFQQKYKFTRGDKLLMINGELIPGNHIVMKDDRSLVPIRLVSELLNAEVKWNESRKEVNIQKNSNHLSLFLDSSTAYVNSQPIELDIAPVLISDRVFLPLRFISENLDCEVEYVKNEIFIFGLVSIDENNSEFKKIENTDQYMEKYLSEAYSQIENNADSNEYFNKLKDKESVLTQLSQEAVKQIYTNCHKVFGRYEIHSAGRLYLLDTYTGKVYVVHKYKNEHKIEEFNKGLTLISDYYYSDYELKK